jgi:hypothetical protein
MSAQTDEIMRQFDSGLEKLRIEILKNLDGTDLLNQEAVHSLVARLNQRLVVAQHDFLDFVNRISGGSSASIHRFELSPIGTDVAPEVVTGLVGAGAGAVLVNVITLTTPGWLWASTTTLGATIATALGVGAGVVTLGVGAIAGAAAAGGIYAMRKRERRKIVRESILKSFDDAVVPRLRTWARQIVDQMSQKLGGS